MQGSRTTKLQKLIAALGEGEHKLFYAYLDSQPSFAKGTSKRRLADVLLHGLPGVPPMSHYPDFGQIQKAVTELKPGTYRNHSSDLAGVLIEFFAIRAIQKRDASATAFRIKVLAGRNLYHLADDEYRDWQKAQKDRLHQHLPTTEDHLLAFEAGSVRNHAWMLEQARKQNPHREPMLQAIARLCFSETVRHTIELRQEELVLHTNHHLPDLFKLLHAFPKQWLIADMIENDHLKVFEMAATSQPSAAFLEFIQIVAQDKYKPEAHRKAICNLCLNQLIKRVNDHAQRAIPDLISAYKLLLQENLLQVEGIMSVGTYKNICSIAVKAGEHEWATQFVNEYIVTLPAEAQDPAFRVCMAIIEFANGNYEACLKQIGTEAYPEHDPYLEYDMRIYAAKCQMLLPLEHTLLNNLTVLENWLKRNNQLAKPHIMHQVQRVRWIKRIARLKQDWNPKAPNKAARDRLLEKVMQEAPDKYRAELIDMLHRSCPD